MEIKALTEKIISGGSITKSEAMELVNAPLDELCYEADRLRKHFNGDEFDMCAILSVKGGRCSENCKFCAQSSCSSASIDSFEVRNEDYVAADAKKYDGIGSSNNRVCQWYKDRECKKYTYGSEIKDFPIQKEYFYFILEKKHKKGWIFVTATGGAVCVSNHEAGKRRMPE